MATKPPKHMRTKGKRSFAKEINEARLLEAIDRYKADPTDVLARIISDTHCGDIPLDKRGDVSLKVLRFLMAEKKAVEHTGKNGEPITVQIVRYADSPSSA